jgi:menaquinol-cytochrome c reductase iron-sulfur subunit
MPDQDRNRRWFLGAMTTGLIAVLGLLGAVPGISYILAPLWKKREDAPGSGFADAGPVADLPVDSWRLLTIAVVRRDGWETTSTNHSVWVRRSGTAGEELTVLSPICPHLGCPVLWHAGDARFTCPCHKGTFDAEGKLTGGPPPRGMDRLENEVRAGRLWIRWRNLPVGSAAETSAQA